MELCDQTGVILLRVIDLAAHQQCIMRRMCYFTVCPPLAAVKCLSSCRTTVSVPQYLLLFYCVFIDQIKWLLDCICRSLSRWRCLRLPLRQLQALRVQRRLRQWRVRIARIQRMLRWSSRLLLTYRSVNHLWHLSCISGSRGSFFLGGGVKSCSCWCQRCGVIVFCRTPPLGITVWHNESLDKMD